MDHGEAHLLLPTANHILRKWVTVFLFLIIVIIGVSVFLFHILVIIIILLLLLLLVPCDLCFSFKRIECITYQFNSFLICFLKVTGLVLRGIFLLRKKELDWFYEGGAAAIFPDGKFVTVLLLFLQCNI